MDLNQKDLNKHKVHFNEKGDSFGHDSNISIVAASDGLNIYLGFLQVNHRYEITFKINVPASLGKLYHVQEEPPNLNARLLNLNLIETDPISYSVTIELVTYKEKLMKEKVLLKSCDKPDNTLSLMLNARVLGKGKGTPFLKNGIKCIGIICDEDESEMSDWQGFEKSN